MQQDKSNDGLLEPLPGAVVPQFIRCGKPSCRCASGPRHGPYFYRVWREEGEVHKAYVKITQVATVRQQTRLYEELGTELRRLVKLRRATSARFAVQRATRRGLLLAWRCVPPAPPRFTSLL